MSKLRVAIYPSDEGGCGSYRVRWPWEAAARAYPEVLELIDLDDTVIGWDRKWDDEPTEYHTPVSIVEVPPVDVMVFQRPLNHKYIEYFRLLREAGITVVVDIDDNFDRIDTRNVAWFGVEPHWLLEEEVKRLANMFGSVNVTRKGGQNGMFLYTPAHVGVAKRTNIREALKNVDLLTVSTPSLLAHYGGTARATVVLENCANEWYFDIAKEAPSNPVPVVGWTGSLATHPGDLQSLGGALEQVRRKTSHFHFNVVGTGIGVGRAIGVEPDHTTQGWVDIQGEYQREYAKFDIALCPLEDNLFNLAKSWLKPLEAAALGVVPVMSPLPEYQRLHAKGVGVLARRPRDWEGALKRLITDEPYRVEMSETAFAVAHDLTYEKQAHRWVDALISVTERAEV